MKFNLKNLKENFILLIFGIPFLVAGLIMFSTTSFNLYKEIISRSWPTTEATTTYSELKPSGTNKKYKLFVKYEYKVNGEFYENNKIYYSLKKTTVENQKEKADEYAEGSIVDAYYNPKNPSDSVLEHGFSFWGVFIFYVLSSIALIISGIVFRIVLKDN